MSLDQFMDPIEYDNSKPSIFIHIFGGHGAGKSGIVGRIREKYGDKIVVLGKYSESKTADGLLTGGLDAVQATTEGRFDLIKNGFFTSKSVVILEGMMVSAFGPFFARYPMLQEKRKRLIYAIYLHASVEKMCERVGKRSGGKEMSEKRLKNIINKNKGSEACYKKIIESELCKKIKFDTSTDDFDSPFKFICKIIDEVL